MNNTLVNQTLIEIEENLREIQSARSQVYTVSQTSQSLIASVSSVIKKIEKLEKDLVEDRESQLVKIGNELLEFQTKLKSNSDNVAKKSSEFLTKHGSDIQNHLRSVSVDMDSFKTNLVKTAKHASDQTASLYQNQSLEISKTIQELKNFQDELKKLDTKIANLDFNSRFENLRKSGETNSLETNSRVSAINTELVKIKSNLSDQSKMITGINTESNNQFLNQKKEIGDLGIQLLAKFGEISDEIQKTNYEIKRSNLITQGILVIGAILMGVLIYIF